MTAWQFRGAQLVAELSLNVCVAGHFYPMARFMAALQYNLLNYFLAARAAAFRMAAGLDATVATGQILAALQSADQSEGVDMALSLRRVTARQRAHYGCHALTCRMHRIVRASY